MRCCERRLICSRAWHCQQCTLEYHVAEGHATSLAHSCLQDRPAGAFLPACLLLHSTEANKPLTPVARQQGCDAFAHDAFLLWNAPPNAFLGKCMSASLMQQLLQDEPMVEPEYMLSKGLWEDIALPALKKVSIFTLCASHRRHAPGASCV